MKIIRCLKAKNPSIFAIPSSVSPTPAQTYIVKERLKNNNREAISLACALRLLLGSTGVFKETQCCTELESILTKGFV